MIKYAAVALVSLLLGVLLVLAFAPTSHAHHSGTRHPRHHHTESPTPSALPSQEATHAIS